MIYILLSLFSFIIGWKFSKVYNLLQFSFMKRKLDDEDIERNIEKKYRNEINRYQEEIYKLRNKIDDLKECRKDLEEY